MKCQAIGALIPSNPKTPRMNFRLTPARNNTKMPLIITISAVPRSGCFMIIKAGRAIMIKQTNTFFEDGGRCSSLRYQDRIMGTASFISSDG